MLHRNRRAFDKLSEEEPISWRSFWLRIVEPPVWALLPSGYEAAPVQTEEVANLSPREARQQLLNLDFGDDAQVAIWLHNAGYLRLEDKNWREPLKDNFEREEFAIIRFDPKPQISLQLTETWSKDNLTPEIVAWLRRFRDLFRWLLSLSAERFTTLLKEEAESSYPDWPSKGVHPPAVIDIDLLVSVIRDCYEQQRYAVVEFNSFSDPQVHLAAGSPMSGIATSVFIDKRYRGQFLSVCENCGKLFEGKRSDQQFCSPRCKNYAVTNARRAKLAAAKRLLAEWNAFSPDTREKLGDKWEWIACWAGHELAQMVDAAWVKKQFSQKQD